MRIVGLAIVVCLLCASKANACSADLDKDGEVGFSDFLMLAAQFGQTCPHATPDTLGALSVEAGYGRIVLPGTQVHLSATVANGPGACVVWQQVRGMAAAISSTNTRQTTVTIPVNVNSMVLVGYAADGFPVYVASGPDAPKGSWELRSGTRESELGGEYDGTFREDWQYVEGSGDLDQCNGRFGITPEFPEGTYHYYLTDDYPYIPRCVWGTPDPSFRQRRAGGPPFRIHPPHRH